MSDLSDNMRALAEKGHPRADELREKAREFDEAITGHFAKQQTVSTRNFMGAWARAQHR